MSPKTTPSERKARRRRSFRAGTAWPWDAAAEVDTWPIGGVAPTRVPAKPAVYRPRTKQARPPGKRRGERAPGPRPRASAWGDRWRHEQEAERVAVAPPARRRRRQRARKDGVADDEQRGRHRAANGANDDRIGRVASGAMEPGTSRPRTAGGAEHPRPGRITVWPSQPRRESSPRGPHGRPRPAGTSGQDPLRDRSPVPIGDLEKHACRHVT